MACKEGMKGVCNCQKESTPFFDNQLISVKRLSEYLAVPVGTIRDWVFKRKIPFVKAGRHVRFNPSDVHKWLEAGGQLCPSK